MNGRPVTNEQMPDEEFEAQRREVLAMYEAGVGDLETSYAFHRRELADRNVVALLAAARSEGRTLVEPRAGVATLEGMRVMHRLLAEAGADILPVSVDSLTRNLRFDDASRAAAESTEASSKLNGFPIVSHGVERARELVCEADRPVHLRGNAIDLRLVAETGFAAGMSGFVSGPMYATLLYSRDVSFTTSIPAWQYVFRLMAKYTDAGVPLANDAIGFGQAGTYSVPSLMHVGVVLDALIMAGQGMKHILVYSMNQGAIAQDIASNQAVAILADEYLARFGFGDVMTYVASSHWNGMFPDDEAAAYSMVALNTLVAASTGAAVVYVKSIEEGIGVPSAEGNAASVRATKYVLHLLGGQEAAVRDPDVEFERELQLMEARSILDAVLTIGDGDPVVGAIEAFAQGVLDVPLAASGLAQGRVLPVRDARGCVRFLDAGNLPLPPEALHIEAERLEARSAAAGRRLGYTDLVDDIHFPAPHT